MQTYAFLEIAEYGRTCREKATFDKKLSGAAQDLGITLAVLLAVLKPVVASDTHCLGLPAMMEKSVDGNLWDHRGQAEIRVSVDRKERRVLMEFRVCIVHALAAVMITKFLFRNCDFEHELKMDCNHIIS
ncbi:hypothetical protein L596_027674 [Steinernema carpocapsae]|uniref:Uncharacterized protein n=1 Tax=Steinernema carpocapsae TaxID=34508 RepID=A0A4V5ZXN1_STECR|nr:hypothetical protein L596_027674 [Steinernema carpocapsae]